MERQQTVSADGNKWEVRLDKEHWGCVVCVCEVYACSEATVRYGG